MFRVFERKERYNTVSKTGKSDGNFTFTPISNLRSGRRPASSTSNARTPVSNGQYIIADKPVPNRRGTANEMLIETSETRAGYTIAANAGLPRVTHRGLPASSSTALNTQWLRAHTHEYIGQWVALNAGQFLGAADALDELCAEVAIPKGSFVAKLV